jgi:aspartyl-tRNA(Asn)/glutamyl-tRNA(Gln) amidotransferase subunit C
MAITREEVLHVARLARLELTEEEISRLELQLSEILAAVGKVSELDLADVAPTSHPLAVVNAFRPDEPRRSLPLDDVFANAPDRDGDHFRVPPTGLTEESAP